MKPSPARIEQLEERILVAADRLLARDGYQQLTMEALANEAGVAKSVLYLHFTSKSDVILAQLDRIAGRVLDGLERIAASSAPPAEKIRQMIILRVMERFDSVQHCPEAVAEVVHDLRAALLQQRERHFAAEARIITKVLEQAEGTIAIEPHERGAFANAVIAATNALLPYSLSALDLSRRREVADKAERIATMLLRGLFRAERGARRRAA
jgi:AcrR family transcriptional regulator